MRSSAQGNGKRRLGLFGLGLASLVLLALTGTLATATGLAAAAADTYKVKNLTAASGPSPFVAGCPGAFHDEQKINGLVLEPAIAVNPTNPRNIIATWKQDNSFFNARDALVASSLDGGKTWQRTTVPGLTRCSGGSGDTASDPWVSFGGDGTAYFGAQSGLMSTEPESIGVSASHSGDGGRHWAAPATVAPELAGTEQPAVTGSPTLPGHAYMTWTNFELDTDPSGWVNPVSFSRTTDGGATWSPAVLIDEAGPFALDQAPRIRVLPNGTLIAIFARADLLAGLATIQTVRSLDEGRTWLPAIEAGAKPLYGDFYDPESEEQLPQPGYPSSTVAPDGTVYVVYENSSSPQSGGIGIVKSVDGGVTWSTIALPGVSAFAFEPAIAVDKHGTVGVIWYDLRNDLPGDAATTADVWFAHSNDGGGNWRQIHVAGPTDLRSAGPAALNRFGEYQGLAGLGNGFAAIFGLASPQAKNGATDIFFAQIGPGE